MESLNSKNRSLWDKVKHEIDYLLRVATAGSVEARKLEKAKRTFEKVYQGEIKNTSRNGGAQYSLLVKDRNGNVSVVNPYQTTKEQTQKYMDQSRKGELNQYTYFPVSKNTPATVLATLQNAGLAISDKPLAMQAKKARQSQIDGQHTEPDGTVIRHHAMSSLEIQETIDKLSDPLAVIHQTERFKTVYEDGQKKRVPAPDNFVFFVTLDNGKETVAVIEFDSYIDDNMIKVDGQGDEYHATVTVFEPDKYRDGEPFDYSVYLASKRTNYELDIIKESPKMETAIRQTEATDSKTRLSNNKETQNGPGVNPQNAEITDAQNKKGLDHEQEVTGYNRRCCQQVHTKVKAPTGWAGLNVRITYLPGQSPAKYCRRK